MLSIFSRGKRQSSQSKTHGKDKAVRNQRKEDQNHAEPTSSEIIMNKAEREVYKFEMPAQERGFTDLLDTHKAGERFPYVAISGDDPESYASRVRRLIQLQPRINKRNIPVPKHITIKLVDDTEEFSLASVLKFSKNPMDYILLKKATFIFSPLVSITDEFTVVVVSLIDTRLRSGQNRRSINLSSNLCYTGEMNLDHCIPRTSCDKIKFNITCEVPLLNTGEEWGACQVFLEVEESDYPQMVAFKEVAATISMPPTGLEEFSKDPAHLDVVVRENHRKRFRGLYLEGDIADETEAIKEKTGKVTYARSSVPLKGAIKTRPTLQPVNDWEAVQNAIKPRIPDDQVSIDPADEQAQSGLSNLSSVEMDFTSDMIPPKGEDKAKIDEGSSQQENKGNVGKQSVKFV